MTYSALNPNTTPAEHHAHYAAVRARLAAEKAKRAQRTCPECSMFPMGEACYHICPNSTHFYSPEQERANTNHTAGREPGREPEDKWASWNSLRNPASADKFLREQRGIELHAGSTKEEIDRAVRIYRASW